MVWVFSEQKQQRDWWESSFYNDPLTQYINNKPQEPSNNIMTHHHQIVAPNVTRSALRTPAYKAPDDVKATLPHAVSFPIKKEASHPLVKSLKMQTVAESDVEEEDIHCLPTTPVPHVFPLLPPSTHQYTEMLFFLFLQHAKRTIFS